MHTSSLLHNRTLKKLHYPYNETQVGVCGFMRVFLLMIMSGWIKIYKQFKDWEWYSKSEMVHLFIHCLLKANFKDGSFQGIEVEKGSFITSLKHLSDETNISIQTIRTCLKKLQLTKEIEVKSTSKLTKITICKYESYQVEEVQANKQVTNKQQTTNKQLTTIEEEKEYKEEKEESTHALCLWIKNDLKNVSKLKQQLTNKEAERLLNKFDRFAVKETLEAMDNHKELIKKNISVNSTIQNWIRRRQENNPNYGVKKESKSLTIQEQILKNYKA